MSKSVRKRSVAPYAGVVQQRPATGPLSKPGARTRTGLRSNRAVHCCFAIPAVGGRLRHDCTATGWQARTRCVALAGVCAALKLKIGSKKVDWDPGYRVQRRPGNAALALQATSRLSPSARIRIGPALPNAISRQIARCAIAASSELRSSLHPPG